MIAALLFLFLAVDGDGDGEEWKVVDRSDGVVTSVRIDREPIRAYRGTIEMAADLFDILAVLHDIERACEWMPRCRTSALIRHTSDFSSLFYLRNASPWLVEDRDGVVETRVRIEPDASEARARFWLRELPSYPPVPGVVRIPRMEGGYVLRRIGESRTEVEYTAVVDPGGMIPRFVSDKAMSKAPSETLRALARRSVEKRGRYMEFRAKYGSGSAGHAPRPATESDLDGAEP